MSDYTVLVIATLVCWGAIGLGALIGYIEKKRGKRLW